jgi:hypothetical protein
MAITYDSLVLNAPVVLNAQNRTLATDMPDIIRRAEDEILERLDRDAFRALLSQGYTVTPTSPTFDLTGEPQRVMEVRAVSATQTGQTVALTPRDVEYLRQLFQGAQGTPRHYAEDDQPSVYRVFPTPDSTWTLRITANIEPLRLAVSNQETLLTRNHARLTEMAVFKHGAIFMRNAADEARYGAQFEAALTEENNRFARRRGDASNRHAKDTASLT